MDKNPFDRMAKALASAATRRGLLRLAAALPPASVLAALLAESSEAGRRRRRKGRHHPGDKKAKRKGKRKGKGHGGVGSDGPCIPGGADLQAAIEAASPGATLTLCAGIFHANAEIAKDLTLIGAGAGQTTVHDNGADGGVLDIRRGASVTVQDLTIAKGDDYHWWGIANFGTLRLVGVTITGGANPVHGSGIYNEGTLTLAAGASVTANRALYAGAGIYNSEGTVTLEAGSSVTDNVALFYGGGIYNDGGTLTVKSGSSVTRNSAGGTTHGGGIYNDGGTVTVESTSSVTDNDPNNCEPEDTIANCIG